MLRDIIAGKIDCILTYKIDRLTRSPKDFYTLIELFDKYGTSFVSITENFDTSSPSGRLLRNIMLTFAQFEREMTAERTRDKMHQRAEKGMWNGGIVPYGYKNIDKKLVVDEAEAECIKEIFQIFIETTSLAETYRQINQKFKTRAGEKFGKGSIDIILRNPVYYGKIFYKDKLYEGTHKSIIPEVIFLKAQSLKKTRIKAKTKINRDYLLSGLIKCSDCGSMMSPNYTKNFHKDGKRPRFTYYYRCTKTMKHDWNSCSIKSVNANKIEDFIINKLKEVSQDEKIINILVRKTNQIGEDKISPLKQQENDLLKEIQETENKIKNLINFLSAAVPCTRAEGEWFKGGGTGFPSVKTEIENLENKKKVLSYDLEGVRLALQKESREKFEAKIVLDTLRDFAQKIDETAPSDKSALIQRLIKSISYGKNNIGIEIFYLPERYLLGVGTQQACRAERADDLSAEARRAKEEGGEVSAGRRWDMGRGRRARARENDIGGHKGEAGEPIGCSKNRIEWLCLLDEVRTFFKENPDAEF